MLLQPTYLIHKRSYADITHPRTRVPCTLGIKFPPLKGIGKGKVVPVLFVLSDHHVMEAYRGSGGIAPRIL